MPPDDERPRRSWREIDQNKDKSSHRKDDRPKPGDKRRQSSQAYRAYKSQLDKIFDGGGVPDALKAKLEESGVGKAQKAKKEALKAITDATGERAVIDALKTYQEAYGFPEDEATLAKLLDLEDTDTVVQALQRLTALASDGQLKRGGSLKGRIKTVQMTLDDEDVDDAAKELLKKL